MSEYRPAKKRVEVSVGESVRIIRELQEMSQNDLAAATGIPQSTISAIENGRVNLGVERAKQLARVLKCHPAVLVFPGWELHRDSAAWFFTKAPPVCGRRPSRRPREAPFSRAAGRTRICAARWQ
ncbi:MAG: helix-turn-helix transcriptional regulator [Gammaproteobacteria bacterium]|nr:helix-turn-helix transcriptional regulator [Gammaproteobacteria bacterium]